MDEEEIKRLVEKFDKRLQLVFLAAVREMKAAPIISLIQRGQIVEALTYVETASAQIATSAGRSLQEAARRTAKVMSENLAVQVAFDQTNFRAVQAVETNNFRLVREMVDSQRDMIRSVISEEARLGTNPREVARRIRDNIGLTSKQESFVNNYRRELQAIGREGSTGSVRTRRLRDRRSDGLVSRAIRDKQPLTEKQINSMVDRYRRKWINYRAEVIARTEGLRAAHEGGEVMYSQAIEEGTLRADQLIRTWVTATDERVRSAHARLNGEKRSYGQLWGPLRFPGDPQAPPEQTVQCRCVLTTRFA